MDIPRSGILIDLDGTLVDSVYHHVLAWEDAFREKEMVVPLWRVHAGIGMGSDRLVPWLLGRPASALGEEAEELVALHKKRFLDRADALQPTEGARDFLADLEDREVPFIIVTSSQGAETEALLAALGRDDLEIANADATEDTKPTPSPVLQACAQIGVDPAHATLVGDSPWDAESAVRAGASAAGVRCGGFSTDALLQAGAALVVDDPRHLIGRL